jgi:hypothetical protein
MVLAFEAPCGRHGAPLVLWQGLQVAGVSSRLDHYGRLFALGRAA